MRKQFAVFGLGSFGTSVALELEKLGCDVIAVDKSMEAVQAVSDDVAYAMCADITDPEVMKKLGAGHLSGAIVAIGDGLESNILTTILAKEAGIPNVIVKAGNSLHEMILKKVGADEVLYPEREMGVRLARGLASGNFMDWIELSDDYELVETKIPPSWVGKRLADLKVREKYGINVVAVAVDGKMEVTADPFRKLPADAVLTLIGPSEAFDKFERL